MQGTSGILLIFGVMFIPIGILKGGIPGKRMTAPVGETSGAGRTFLPVWMNSGGQMVFGIGLIIIGADFIAVPGYLVLKSVEVIGTGAAIAILGAILTLRGARLRK